MKSTIKFGSRRAHVRPLEDGKTSLGITPDGRALFHAVRQHDGAIIDIHLSREDTADIIRTMIDIVSMRLIQSTPVTVRLARTIVNIADEPPGDNING